MRRPAKHILRVRCHGTAQLCTRGEGLRMTFTTQAMRYAKQEAGFARVEALRKLTASGMHFVEKLSTGGERCDGRL